MDEFVAYTRTLVRSVPDPERFNDFEPQAVHPRSRIEERTFKPRPGYPARWVGRVSPGVAACPGEFALLFLVDLGTAWSSGAGQ